MDPRKQYHQDIESLEKEHVDRSDIRDLEVYFNNRGYQISSSRDYSLLKTYLAIHLLK